MLTRAYSTLTVKTVDEDQRIIEGIASSPVVDRDGDIMEPGGAQFKLPMPLLWLHRQDEPIGVVTSATVTKSGIKIRAQIGKGVSPEVDRVWSLVKSGLVRGFSIGSRLVEYSRIQATGGLHVQKWNWLETSVVTIPANQEATISTIKSLDARPAGSGTGAAGRTHTPVVSGSRSKGVAMTNAERIQNTQEELTTKSARMQELIDLAETDAGLSAEDQTEQDTLTADVTKLHKALKSYQALELTLGTQAVPVTQKSNGTEPRRTEARVIELEKGIRFARVAMAIANGKGSISDTLAYAKRWNGQTPEVSKFIKDMMTKAVEGSTVDESPGWGSELVYANNIAGELIDLLRAATIMDKIQGFRTGVFNTRMVVQTGGSTVDWVEEGAPKPVTELAFDTLTLPFHKMAGIVVLTQELARHSSPSAERAVRDDLVKQIARFKDRQFLLTSVSLTAGHPAAITNGVSSPAASGTDADALYADLNTALATFDEVEDTSNLHILMTPALARGISTLRNSMGIMEFPQLNARGGTLMGYPVIVSGSVPSGTIIIINPADILVADDRTVSLDASSQATLDMAGGSTPTLNLWQRNMIGIRAELACTWKKVRDESVAIIDTASYGPSGS